MVWALGSRVWGLGFKSAKRLNEVRDKVSAAISNLLRVLGSLGGFLAKATNTHP